jgi:hypothetical protein
MAQEPSTLIVKLLDDMSDEDKETFILERVRLFDGGSQDFVRSVFQSTTCLNVRTIHIEYSVGIDGLWTAIGAFYTMRNSTIRKFHMPN